MHAHALDSMTCSVAEEGLSATEERHMVQEHVPEVSLLTVCGMAGHRVAAIDNK